MSKGVAFGADLAMLRLRWLLQAEKQFPESVKVTFKGNMKN